MSDLTIIVPYRNRAHTLPRLIASLEEMQGPEVDVLLVDNGSSDEGPEIAAQYALRSRHAVRCISEPRAGANVARNTGLRQATTTWVYFFDSDDELTPHFLTAAFRPESPADMQCLRTTMVVGKRHKRRAYLASARPSAQALSGTLCTPAVVWRRTFLERIGAWNERLSVWQDWELALRALVAQPQIEWRPKNEAHHRLHQRQESITRTTDEAQRIRTLLAALALADALGGPAKEQAALRRALILRSHITLHRPIPFLREGPITALLARALSLYARLLPGAWRLALLFV